MEQVYPGNWQTRWSKTPYMKVFAEQKDIDKFVKSVGKFESVPGHVWACIGFWMHLRKACRALDKLVNSQEIYERFWAHDIGETHRGDISYAVKIHTSLREGKEEEREDFIKLTKGLSKGERKTLLRWLDEFEGKVRERDLPLEVLVVRWIDNLEGDHFALTFGNNHRKYSDTIEKIVKKRSAARAKSLINYLTKHAKHAKKEKSKKSLYIKAAFEVKEVMKLHINLIKKAGVKIDFFELGL